MADAIARIRDYAGGQRKTFDASRMVQDAVVRNLQTLTESSQRLSDEIKSSEPRVPWRELSGFRNIVVHGYLGVDLGVIWSVVESELPSMENEVGRMAAKVAGSP